jgi:hypothetical protein
MATLTPRAVVFQLANYLFPRGASFNTIIRTARVFGVSYRRADMLYDLRRWVNKFRSFSMATGIDWNKRVPYSRMPATEFKKDFKFRVHADILYRDPLTGEIKRDPHTRYTNAWLSPSGYEDYIDNRIKNKKYEPGFEFAGVEFKGVERMR